MIMDKEFVGGYVDKKLKESLQKIARKEKRSVSAVLEIFLASGVKHQKTKKEAK